MKLWTNGFLAILCVCGLLVAAGCGGGGSEPAEEPIVEAPAEEPAEAPAEEPVVEAPAEEPVAAAPSGGSGDEDQGWDAWHTGNAIWVGSPSEFVFETDPASGMLRANTNFSDNRIRDLYLGRKVEGLTSGQTYTFKVDFMFDGVPEVNYIQYIVQQVNRVTDRAVSRIEDYPDRPRPDTKYVDSSLIGNGEVNTIEFEHTVGEGETDAALMMIVRFQTENRSNNWFSLGNFRVE